MRTSIPIRPKNEREHRMSLAQSKLGYTAGLYPLLIGVLGLGITWAGWLVFNAVNPPRYGSMGPGQSFGAYLILFVALAVFSLSALAGLLLLVVRFIRG